VNWTSMTAPRTQYRRSAGIWLVKAGWARAGDGGLGSASLVKVLVYLYRAA